MDILGIDIGGSALKAAPVNPASGTLTAARLRIETPQPATPAAIAEIVQQAVDHFKWTGSIGCGLPAVIRNGTACTAANIDPSWIGTHAVELFATKTGRDFKVLNDADAAGLAEMNFGAGKAFHRTSIVVTVGTGLGTALFHNQVLFPGTELGHLQLHGKKAEHLASAAVRTELNLSYREWAKRFNEYLHLLEDLFWPDLFIIGGAISQEHEKFFPFLDVSAEIKPAVLRNDAGIIGAAIAVNL